MVNVVLPKWLKRVNFATTAMISAGVLIFGIIFGIFFFPWMLKKMVKSQMNLTPQSSVREMYTKVPFAIDFRIYMFNLLNPDEVSRGAKPRVQEVGPYYFEEWKEKFDMIDDDAEDTLKYHYKNTFIFRPDLSAPLTGNEIITMPHPLIAGMFLATNVDKKPMLPIIVKAVDEMFHQPKNIFWTGRAMDMLFDGVPIDCSSDEFEAKAACSIFEAGEVAAIKPHNDTHFSFSLFAGTNGTDLGQFTVFRGKKNSADIGRVIAFNDEPEMDYWGTEECNQYVGTDSTIFAPYMDKNDGIWAYEPSVCRSLGATYGGKSKYMGVPTASFDIDIGSPENDKECFCRDPPDDCPRKGTFDLFRCVGSPMFGSMPHFYNSDPWLVQNFESGINPNKEKHAIFMHFEMMSGTPLSAAKRLQFNLEVKPIPQVPLMKNMREMYYPLFWVEEAANLNKTYVNMIKNSLVLAVRINRTIKWICIIGGILGLVFSGVIFYMKENDMFEVTPVKKNGVMPKETT